MSWAPLYAYSCNDSLLDWFKFEGQLRAPTQGVELFDVLDFLKKIWRRHNSILCYKRQIQPCCPSKWWLNKQSCRRLLMASMWAWTSLKVVVVWPIYLLLAAGIFSLHCSFGDIYVMGGKFKSNGTTSMPKSVSRLVVDKVKLLFSSEMFLFQSILFDIRVPNKSLSQELNNRIKTI